jgi:hypothetical protein
MAASAPLDGLDRLTSAMTETSSPLSAAAASHGDGALAAASLRRSSDFDLWRGMEREFAEELLGASEEYPHTPVSYADWPFARSLDQARAAGSVRPWVLGLGVDPLTFATDLLTAVVIDAPVFDDLFGAIVEHNAEGRVLFGDGDRGQFTADGIGALAGPQPMQAAGAALLRLAWRHRDHLLA